VTTLLCFGSIRSSTAPEIPFQLPRSILGLDELKAVDRLRLWQDRRRKLLQYVVARSVVAGFIGVDACELTLARDRCGRPYYVEARAAGVDFNSSGSGDATLVGVTTTGRIGVDLEQTTFSPNLDLVAQRYFPSVRDEVRTLSDGARALAYLSRWCLLEARLKYLGCGLSLGVWNPLVSALTFEPAAGYVAGFASPTDAVLSRVPLLPSPTGPALAGLTAMWSVCESNA
jgi:phosphopantetheinyl transferase